MNPLQATRNVVEAILSEVVIFGKQDDAPKPDYPFSSCHVVSVSKTDTVENVTNNVDLEYVSRVETNVRVTTLGEGAEERVLKVLAMLNSVIVRRLVPTFSFVINNPLIVKENVYTNGENVEKAYVTLTVRSVEKNVINWYSIDKAKIEKPFIVFDLSIFGE